MGFTQHCASSDADALSSNLSIYLVGQAIQISRSTLQETSIGNAIKTLYEF